MKELAVVAFRTLGTVPLMSRAVVVDGLHTKDRPSAVGFALFNFMRDCNRKFGRFPDVTVRMGTVSAQYLNRQKANGEHIYTPILHDGEYGYVYELIAAVEHGSWGIFGS